MPSSVKRLFHSTYLRSSSRRASRTTKSIRSWRVGSMQASHGQRHVLRPRPVLVAHGDLAGAVGGQLALGDLALVVVAVQAHPVIAAAVQPGLDATVGLQVVVAHHGER